MNKQDIMEWFYQNSTSLSTLKIIGIFVIGLLTGAIIYFTYRITYSGVAYNNKFNLSNIVILLITTVLMLMISSNIVISMGMVGALSIVRFRTAIKDPRDTIFIFWSIAEGLCVGTQNNRLAIISSLIIAAVLIIATLNLKPSKKYLLIIRANSIVTEEKVRQLLTPNVTICKTRNISKNVDTIEMIFDVVLKKNQDESALKVLFECPDIVYINWLIDSGGMVG